MKIWGDKSDTTAEKSNQFTDSVQKHDSSESSERTYIHPDFLDRIVVVLIDDTLRLVLESADDIVRPPLLQVSILVILPSYRVMHIHQAHLNIIVKG